jgi:hypothetical protein
VHYEEWMKVFSIMGGCSRIFCLVASSKFTGFPSTRRELNPITWLPPCSPMTIPWTLAVLTPSFLAAHILKRRVSFKEYPIYLLRSLFGVQVHGIVHRIDRVGLHDHYGPGAILVDLI